MELKQLFKKFKMKNKKALSAIVGGLLMVLLVLVMVGFVWGITKSIVDKNTDTSCFGNYGEVTLNNDYTCYHSGDEELNFS